MSIEIKPEDIIDKPPGFVPNTGGAAAKEGGGFNIASIKKMLKEGKELMDMAGELGIDLSKLGLNLPGQKKENKAGVTEKTTSLNIGQQVNNFIKLLQISYGDITVNEALERLRADFGGLKLSELSRKSLK